ncbi:Archaellum biogenesis protein FlaJ, TadC family [Haladaptatus litoreus]|uniref:Archaellum biogenesis protein FlaJ, TadC family n=1 Tax=Haladaptatus litoreus TaxID=553468 RepID=A0A1N6W723_9EURY|nr:type II secretion system F family protein [Haladaptatus litoreus]SIQ85921.1 Archaellum biogenesis protein FlaJ, TadC family [Haladaptatus litoreus]
MSTITESNSTETRLEDSSGTENLHSSSSLGILDRALYALFSRHADRTRHDRDRKRYRATDVNASFDVYLSRTYGLSWVVFLAIFCWAFLVTVAIPDSVLASLASFLHDGLPLLDRVRVPNVQRMYAATGLSVACATISKRTVVWAGGLYLGWSASARRSNIERTLPGAVRYLRALSSGSDDKTAMLRKVADREESYGDTAVAFRKVLNKAALTGSVDDGLRIVARDTPSRDVLAPFLLKFREHAEQGPDALEQYLQMESRMLSHRQSRSREQAEGFLELIAEMFIVLLVTPALLVIVLTVMSVLAPGLAAPAPPPFGWLSMRALIIYSSGAFILVVGAGAAVVMSSLRPADQSAPKHSRSSHPIELLKTLLINPANTAVLAVPLAFCVGGLLWMLDYTPVDTVLLSYVAFALPVGLVSVRRSRIDDAKDREIKDFVHAVSAHVGLGRPFSTAVERVARDVDMGALQSDVTDLAFNANLTSRDGDLRRDALTRFVENVGTPMADQTIGLVTGTLDVGGDTETVFDTLQVEIGRLYHQKKALRSNMLVYVVVGWTTALLIIGIMIAVNAYVLDSFSQLSAVSNSNAGLALDPNAVQPARDRHRFYVVTQTTMLACGWFAGYASRGFYEALLHSAALVTVAYFVFAGAGMI